MEEGELSVDFDDREVIYGFGELDELALAYATTIHKSQGSEYPAVVIPLTIQHYTMLQRNLVYAAAQGTFVINYPRENKLGSPKGRRDFFASSNGGTGMGNSHGRFVWYELMTTDMKTAKLFYANVVGWGARDASAPALGYRLFTVADLPVAGLMKMPEDGQKTGAPPHWIGYVGVDDVDSVVDRIKQLGGAVHVPPTDVPGISRFSIVADPQMATLALVKGLNAGQAQSAELGAPCRVGWHELLAADWETAFAFYGELFGWQKAGAHASAIGTYQQFSADGETLGGMLTKPPALPFPFWLYYFNVDDVETAAQRVEAGGGQILYGPTAVPGGAWIAHCTDPQGAIFGLLDRRQRKAIGYFISSA